MSKIAYQYLILKDTSLFRALNNEAYELAVRIKDTFSLADIHWSKANLYKGLQVYDSAYYHYNEAYRHFESIDHQYYAAKMLYGMSFIKGRFRDYPGSEILMVKAIEKYKGLHKYEALFGAYEHLGILYKELKEYDRALFYYNKALEYQDKIENSKLPEHAGFNNIALVYQHMGEYDKALGYFDRILKDDSLGIKDITHYARVLDNKAYCRLLSGDTTNLEQDFYKSLSIRDSLHNLEGLAVSNIHLSEFYIHQGDTVRARFHAREANRFASKVDNGRDYLASLQLLAKTDRANGQAHLERYIVFNDSLQDVDRRIQNKFTRIAYETDEYIAETKRLSQQKTLILIGALVLLLIISLVYYIIVQKSRNEKLLLETEQQKANEQVYLLTLKQQTKLEEEKTRERNRIAEELHDGILGKLFGVRVDLGFLDIQGDETTLRQHELFLDELQKIEGEIREVSHKLNTDFNSSEIDFNVVLRQLLENKGRAGGFSYQLDVGENIGWGDINEVIKVNLYRIVQEALQNVIKYAKAQKVALSFSLEKDILSVCLNDDGVGFNTKKQQKGIGMKNIRSRIQKLHGTFSVQSETGKGTTLCFTIPTHQNL
ncbi:tetratricopeptide repeat-containing sensor histidine kinase [Flagellimonas sp.]|uniref:tetratricopeptide repeat-containing sensor histidine kinase n=1 Tax=Flagellimonas sp. TaxID=2058762 RepID=UPI003AB579C3